MINVPMSLDMLLGQSYGKTSSQVNVDNSRGKCMHFLQQNSLARISLTQEQCIGDSFDRAANISGVYFGLNLHLSMILTKE